MSAGDQEAHELTAPLNFSPFTLRTAVQVAPGGTDSACQMPSNLGSAAIDRIGMPATRDPIVQKKSARIRIAIFFVISTVYRR